MRTQPQWIRIKIPLQWLEGSYSPSHPVPTDIPSLQRSDPSPSETTPAVPHQQLTRPAATPAVCQLDEGKPFTRSIRVTKWIGANWGSLLGWAIALIMGLILLGVISRPVQVEAPATPPPVVIKEARLQSVIHVKSEDNKTYGWEGAGDPTSAEGRWVPVVFKIIK